VPGLAAADQPYARQPASLPATLQTTTDAHEQNNTGPLGGPVISNLISVAYVSILNHTLWGHCTHILKPIKVKYVVKE